MYEITANIDTCRLASTGQRLTERRLWLDEGPRGVDAVQYAADVKCAGHEVTVPPAQSEQLTLPRSYAGSGPGSTAVDYPRSNAKTVWASVLPVPMGSTPMCEGAEDAG